MAALQHVTRDFTSSRHAWLHFNATVEAPTDLTRLPGIALLAYAAIPSCSSGTDTAVLTGVRLADVWKKHTNIESRHITSTLQRSVHPVQQRVFSGIKAR